eukprot:TRINITY_DN8515_c0_g1_i1.p4 TRINITY_DN8515_c0_g1~~TRINITY_DN8515_c0_g1_i1.p4  ORF type:complete len:124 (+),score=8.74 TRINITY_DN8515_c0_g1_i1:331-702(+)
MVVGGGRAVGSGCGGGRGGSGRPADGRSGSGVTWADAVWAQRVCLGDRRGGAAGEAGRLQGGNPQPRRVEGGFGPHTNDAAIGDGGERMSYRPRCCARGPAAARIPRPVEFGSGSTPSQSRFT